MNEDFGALLRHFRTVAGLSQEQLAERATLSVQAISVLERGLRRAPYRATVAQLCDALSLTVEDRERLENAAVRHREKRRASTAENHVAATGAFFDGTLPPMIGRAQERDETLGLLERDEINLVTLVGPGGIGKTRLALALSAGMARNSDLQTFFVALAPIREPEFVLPTIATSLGVRADGGRLVDAVAGRVGNRRTLLVLDNAEHVIEQSAEAAALLSNIPGLTVLVTSRTPLHLRSERVVRLEPLSPAAAIELFIERARATGTRAQFDTSDATVAQIVRLVDGLPLAIELAAAQTRLEPLAALSLRLERRLDVLVDGPRDFGERHRTMRAAIAWSYELCSDDERRVFRALALFAGGCTPSTAASVLEIPDERQLVDHFSSLFDKSLVIGGGDDRALRVTMLETIREFAAEQLAADPEAPRLRRAFAELSLARAEHFDAQLMGSEQGRAIAALEREHDNLRSAIAWARDEGETTLGLRLVGALWRFWSRRGHLAEGSAWSATMLALADRSADPSALAARARALLGAGMLTLRLGDAASAQSLLEESLALHRRIRDARGIFFALNSLGLVARARGDLLLAQRLHEESLAARRAAGRSRDVSVALANLGVLALDRHDHDNASTLFEQSLHAMDGDADTDPWVCAFTLHYLANVARRRGDRARSLALLEESLEIRRELLDTLGVVQTLVSLGELALEDGDEATALEHYRAAIDENRRIGAPQIFAEGFVALAAIFARRDDPERATHLLAKAASIHSGGTTLARDTSIVETLRVSLFDILGTPAFEGAWKQGAALDYEQAVLIATGP